MADSAAAQPGSDAEILRSSKRSGVVYVFVCGLISVALLGIYVVFSWGMGDLYGYKVRYALEQWQEKPAFPSVEEVAVTLADVDSALRWEGDNPEYVELKGRVLYYRALVVGFNEQGLVDIAEAKALHQKAISLRPRWPYSWANLVLVKAYLNEFDEEYHQALISAVTYGPWEKSVHLTLAHAAALSWPSLSLEQKRLFARNIERGMVRTLPEEDAILSAYQKKTSICAYLTRDYLQNKLCSS